MHTLTLNFCYFIIMNIYKKGGVWSASGSYRKKMKILVTAIDIILTIAVLSILYIRMIKREKPEPIKARQALLPVAFGGVSLAVSFGIVMLVSRIITASGYKPEDHSLLLQSFMPAFFSAAFPEEIAKMAALIISLIIFRGKIKNLYEYILIGAAVGIGFTVVEDVLYADGKVATMLIRLIMIAGHLVFNMIMAEFIGRARLNKNNSAIISGSYYILAFIIPVGIHTLYDMGTAFNKPAFSDDILTGVILAAAGIFAMVFAQIFVLTKFKKNALKYCEIEG